MAIKLIDKYEMSLLQISCSIYDYDVGFHACYDYYIRTFIQNLSRPITFQIPTIAAKTMMNKNKIK